MLLTLLWASCVAASLDLPNITNPYSIRDIFDSIIYAPNPIPRDPVNRTYEVKFLYIVPSDRIPRDGINQTLTNLIRDLQAFFSYHLDRTFTLTDPPFELIRSPYTEADIKNGTYSTRRHVTDDGAGDPWLNSWENMLDMIYDDSLPYFFERNAQRILHFSITEIDEWAALGGGGLASVGGQELDRYQRYPDITNVYPFEHELGHALGLHHTPETIECLVQNSLPYTTRYTFMTQPPMISNNIHNMEDYEKRLLLGLDGYTSQCLLTLGDQEHPINYLSVCTKSVNLAGDPEINVEDLSTLLVNWGQCADKLRCSGDLNCDYDVDVQDLSQLLVNWG